MDAHTIEEKSVLKPPVWPPGPRRRNSWYRKRVLYAEIVKGSFALVEVA